MNPRKTVLRAGLLAALLALSVGTNGCVGSEKCFDGLSISASVSEANLRATGDAFCRGKGYDRQVSTSSRNGKIEKICCARDGIV